MSDPWEDHAEWWQREFTDGVDPEYTEQILPLIHQHLPNGGRLLDVGCGEGQVDAAVACLVFEHIEDLDSALAEVARVVRPGGTFLFLLNHPLLQTPGSGWIDDQVLDPPEQYWRIGPYLVEGDTVEQVENGVFIRFFHRPLSRYLNTAAELGLQLVRMEEPAPPKGFLDRAPEYLEAASIPRLLFLRFERR